MINNDASSSERDVFFYFIQIKRENVAALV